MRPKSHVINNCIAFLLVFAVIVSCFAFDKNTVKAETTSEKIKKAEELKQATEEMKEATESKKDGLEDQKKVLVSYLSELNNNLTEITENISDIENQIADKQKEIENAEQELEEAKQDEVSQYDLMKKRVKFMYEKGTDTLLMSLFTAKSYSDFLNKAEYINHIENYDKKMYEKLIEIREDIEQKEEQLRYEKKQLEELHAEAKSEEEKVSDLVVSTNGSIAETNGQISAAELETAAYDAELKAQDENIAALKKQLAEEQAMIAKAAKMAWRNVSELEFQEGDRDLLACLIYCEAGNQPFEGQVAVGAVVINRVRSAAYPNTISGVIYQKSQFSPVGSGRLATRLALGANSACYQAADQAMSGVTPVGNCLYFRTIIPQISGQIIGDHVFY